MDKRFTPIPIAQQLELAKKSFEVGTATITAESTASSEVRGSAVLDQTVGAPDELRIERLPQRLIWGEVRLKAEYPRSELHLKIYTYSLDQAWLRL